MYETQRLAVEKAYLLGEGWDDGLAIKKGGSELLLP
jgi:hypothetical protein